MYYPWLDVPVLTSSTLQSIIAVVCAFVVYYAVGGGLLLALENGRAVRAGDSKYRVYLKRNAHFFITLTIPLGLILAFGRWIVAGMTAPLATHATVNIFVFAWAIVWSLTLLALFAVLAFYYSWDRLSPRASRRLGWLFAFSAWLAFVTTISILSFALNSTSFLDDGESSRDLFHALLNVQFLPQTVAKTGAALLVGALWFIFHAAGSEKDFDLREQVVRRMRLPAFLGLVMLIAGFAGRRFFLAETSRLTLQASSSAFLCIAFFVAFLIAIFILLVIGPCSRPRDVGAGQGAALLILAFFGFVAAEIIDVAARRPYGVDRVVYRNQLSPADVADARQTGLLYKGTWTTYALDALQEDYPDLKISAQRYLGAESIHLEPPLVPESSSEEDSATTDDSAPEDEDAAPPSESEEGLESELSGQVADQRVALGYFSQTVAQQLRGGQSGFVPVSSDPNTNSLRTMGANQQPPSLLQSHSQPPPASLNAPSGAQGGYSVNIAPDPAQSPSLSAGTQRLSGVQSVAQPEAEREVSAFDYGTPQRQLDQTQPLQSVGTQLVQDAANVEASRPTETLQPTETPRPTEIPDDFAPVPEDEDANENENEDSFLDVEVAEDKPDEEAESTTRLRPSDLDLDVNGPIARGNEELLQVKRRDRLELGRMVFMYHCNSCHAAEFGVSALGPRVAGRSVDELKNFALQLNYIRFDMPPWAGTEVEAELLAEYLDSFASKIPNDAFLKEKLEKEESADSEKKADEPEETEPQEEATAPEDEDTSAASFE
ncbi:MAG: hypothetical protein ACOX0A_05785 [Thermoguttaceae bacterium]|jgi:hypothetical protein